MEATKESYKLKVRIGNAEFEADGPEDIVKSQYDQFLELANRMSLANEATSNSSNATPSGELEEDDLEEDFAQWNRVFIRKGDKLSLHVLPTGKGANGDAILLMLYGYQMIFKQDSVRSTDLMESAKQSGLRIDRIDRNIPASHKPYINRGGSGKGTRYSLNNRGSKEAQAVLEDLID